MNGNENAFAAMTFNMDGQICNEREGLTKREYFAAFALQGLVAKYNLKNPEDQGIVTQMAVELSDELIKQLNK